MTTVNARAQLHSYLLPTSKPVQIWPDLKPTQISPSAKKSSLQKFYKFIVLLSIISAIFSNGYFLFTRLSQQSLASKPPTTASIAPIPQLVNLDIFNILPQRLIIPSINVDAIIQQVGQTPDGAMDVPTNTSDVGWYKLGPKPGQRGSAVIDAHVDGPDGSPAVFSQLTRIKEGDEIIVVNSNNTPIYFTVKRIGNYPVNDTTSEVFNSTDGVHLNLITCNGVWDYDRKTYSQRLIVFADAMQP